MENSCAHAQLAPKPKVTIQWRKQHQCIHDESISFFPAPIAYRGAWKQIILNGGLSMCRFFYCYL